MSRQETCSRDHQLCPNTSCRGSNDFYYLLNYNFVCDPYLTITHTDNNCIRTLIMIEKKKKSRKHNGAMTRDIIQNLSCDLAQLS